jgi:hypothetical protein
MKGTICQEEISILNIYAPNTGAHIYIKKISNGHRALIYTNTVIVGDLNTLFSSIDRSSRQKISKENLELLHILYQINMVDIDRVFHPITSQCTLFSAAHGTFSKIGHIYDTKQENQNNPFHHIRS